MNALIFGTTCQIRKILFPIDSPIPKEGFRLYKITLRLLGAEHIESEAEAKERAGGGSPLGRCQGQPKPKVTEEKVPSAATARAA